MDSVLAQDFEDLELIVVDDASDDGTPAVIRACNDPRLRPIRLSKNGGVARARNRGIAEARGRYIAFLDSDDAWLPGKLTAQTALLDAAPSSVALVYGGLKVQGPQGERLWSPKFRGYIFPAMLAANRMFAAPSTMLVRREVVDWLGGFDPTLSAIEDYDFLLRVCRFYAVEALDGPLATYDDREAETEGTARRSRRLAANLTARDALARRYSADMRNAGLEQGFLLDTSLRALRGGGSSPCPSGAGPCDPTRSEAAQALWLGDADADARSPTSRLACPGPPSSSDRGPSRTLKPVPV